MEIDFSTFNKSAKAILERLALTFPTSQAIGYKDLFPETTNNKVHDGHKSVIAFLEHEKLIARFPSTNAAPNNTTYFLTELGLTKLGTSAMYEINGILE
ncbi:hypothetical protein [Pseudoalteromonas sp.]|uniref:hypothetical protein n=1 Tax=Pseudoalteromonas sp. TaxID=53249 RepID=UPI0023549F7F|nr:hypothetical protein [Pseudoalteromonas sp.]